MNSEAMNGDAMNAADITLPPRDPDGHKGTFGRVLVIGGALGQQRPQDPFSMSMIGAPMLAARGVVRSGAGGVVLAVPEPLLPSMLAAFPAAMGVALPVLSAGQLHASRAAELIDHVRGGTTVTLIGPGLREDESSRQILLRLTAEDDRPMVIDAGALNLLAGTRDFASDLRAPAILTPHPGEFARLARALDLAEADSDLSRLTDREGRLVAAQRLAGRLGAICVLKGPRTVVSDGIRTAVCNDGGPALATSGSGDVLAGIIAGCVSQFHAGIGSAAGDDVRRDLFACACLGVVIHARAGDSLARSRGGESGILPGEIADAVPAVMGAMRNGTPD